MRKNPKEGNSMSKTKASKSLGGHISVEVADDSYSRSLVRDLAGHGHLPKKSITECSKLSEKQLQEVLQKYKDGTLSGPAFQTKT